MKRFESSLLAGVIAICATATAVLLYAMWSLTNAADSQRDLSASFTGSVSLAQELRQIQSRRDGAFPVFLITANPEILQTVKTLDLRFLHVVDILRARTSDPRALAAINNIEAQRRQLLVIERPGIAKRLNGATASEIDRYFHTYARPIVTTIDAEVDSFVDRQTAAYRSQMSADRVSIRFALCTLGAVAILSLLFCAVVIGLILRLLADKRTYDALLARVADQERAISLARKEAVETVAHDLRNPLSAITMIASCLRMRSTSETDHRTMQLLDGLEDAAGTMDLLIANILDQSKIGAGKLVLEREPCALHELVSELVRRHQFSAEGRHISIICAVPVDLPLIDVDRVKTGQVISNLLNNAIKFTPLAGTIALVARVDEAGVRCNVMDTGPGMDPKDIKHVFDRHWQNAETASAGTGLGLAISKVIVEAHGGLIEAYRNTEQGMCFSFWLPVHSEWTPVKAVLVD